MTVAALVPDYHAHPMLDPDYLDRESAAAAFLRRAFDSMSVTEEAYNRGLNRFLHPFEHQLPLAENLELVRRYLVDVNAYVHEVLDLLGPGWRRELAMDAEVAAQNEILGLLDIALGTGNRRMRFEAQRKLYLAKLLFDIDHDPGIQMGPVHREYFDGILDRELWSGAKRAKPVDLYYNLAEDGKRIEIRTKSRGKPEEVWRFHLTPIRWPSGTLHVYHYACRFKREVAPFLYASGAELYEVEEKPIWETLHERRSGSILSKMIRKGEVHPRKIQDILGAMFIVKDENEVNRFQELLFTIFGGPLRWKDRVNTISNPEDRRLLNVHSAPGYEVLKSDVDVLYAPREAGRMPYIFSVEVQIYTVEGFLRTVHSRHYASHQRLKLRQFLEGLLPSLFPVSIYGESLIRRCLETIDGDGSSADPR